MPKSPRQKQKLLYVLQYLWEHTDDNHIVSTPQLIAFLEQNGISAERKSIYDDIQTLQNFGVDVIRDGGKRGGYKLASREFELAEVKLLVENRLAGVIIDRFGKNVMLIPVDEEHFSVNVDVYVSNQFLGWIFSLGESVKIVEPDEVVERMKQEIERLRVQYK